MPNVASIARVCEMYFEWGVKETIIKRFRTVIWPGAVLRILRRAARDQDQKLARLEAREDTTNMATPRKNKTTKRPPPHLAVGTPSKIITKYFSTLGIESPEKLPAANDDDEEEDEEEAETLLDHLVALTDGEHKSIDE